MKIDFATLAFGYTIRAGGGNPNWATSLGQGAGYRINESSEINEVLKGMVYSSVPLSKIESKIGKGGRVIKGDSPESPIILGALFSKVYINDTLINNGKYVLLITRDTSKSHAGRLRLKYGPSNAYNDLEETYSNERFFTMAKQQIGLAADACFFISEINIVKQNELILKTFIVNKYQSVEYADSNELHSAWENIAGCDFDIPKDEEVEDKTISVMSESIQADLSIDTLGQILAEMYNKSEIKTTAIHMFGVKYGAIIKEKGYVVTEIIAASGLSASYHTEVSKGVKIYESILKNEYGIKFYEEKDDVEQIECTGNPFPVLSERVHKTYPLNSILYGAPGTGKTYSTAQYALAIIENKSFESVKKEKRSEVMKRYNQLIKEGQIIFTTFHQSYGYEDFIQGIRPDTSAKDMVFKTVNGVFKVIAERAMESPEKKFVIVIDEINRANISKVFGELITLIEEDKRWGEMNAVSVALPSGELFAVPNNLYIVGTMNSADKSISLIDTALRRRFEFVEFVPNIELVSDERLKDILKKLNEGLAKELDSKDLLVGHSYFMGKTIDDICDVMNRNIIPLLYEYFFDNQKKVEAQIKKALEGIGVEIESGTMGRIKLIKKDE